MHSSVEGRRLKVGELILLVWAMSGGPAHGQVGSADADYELLRATQEVFRSVLVEIRPSLVRIETVGGSQPGPGRAFQSDAEESEGKPRSQSPFRDSPGGRFLVADGPTTGLVYSADGLIVTSSFNFVREPVLISVMLADGRRLAADLIARDQVRKIALLHIDATDLPVPPWRSIEDVRVGEWAVALGLGFGGDDPSIAVGIISALHRMRANAFQTDARLSPANYGGPVCDVAGRVVGLAVPMAQRPGELAGVEMYDSGVGFAIPKNRLDEIVAELKTGRSFYRGWLGISIDPHVPDALVIRNLAEPSPMQEAGVLPGDRILAVDGTPIRHFGHLVQALYMVPAGQSVHLSLQRDGADFEATVTLARSDELGPLPDLPEPFDPAEPFPAPPGAE